MVLPPQVPAAGPGGKAECARRGAGRCEAASVLSALGWLSAEKKRQHELGTGWAVSLSTCLTPAQAGTVHLSKVTTVGQSQLPMEHGFGPRAQV